MILAILYILLFDFVEDSYKGFLINFSAWELYAEIVFVVYYLVLKVL